METTTIYEQALRSIAWLSEPNSLVEDIASTALLDTDLFDFGDKNQLELFPEELPF